LPRERERERERERISHVLHGGSQKSHFLGALAKLRKVSSCLSVRPSVRPNVATPLPPTYFHENCYLRIFRKSVQKIQVSLKSYRITGTSLEDRYTLFIIPRWIVHRMTNVSEESCRENQNTQFVSSNFCFFRKSCRFIS